MFSPVSDLLNRFLRRHGIHEQVQTAAVLRSVEGILREWFGEDIFRYIEVKYVRGGALVIASTSSAATQAIRLRNDEILAKIREKFSNADIKTLVFVAR